MRALILAAGLGTRLRPYTLETPKCLVRVGGKPLLEYWLDMLCNNGISPVLVNLHYLAEKVEAYLEASPYKGAVYTVREKTLLGTGGSLLKNSLFFGGEALMLIHGDNLSRFDMDDFIRAHKNRPSFCEITMMTFETTAPESCGIVELSEDGVVQGFYEKVKNPPGNLANGAVYIIEPGVVDYLVSLQKEVIDFSTEVLPAFVGKIYTFHNQIYHRDIGTPESLAQASADFCDPSIPML